jgi:uncharacterized RDD family membrane protein YckC
MVEVGFFKRLVAYIIDGIIVGIVAGIIQFVVGSSDSGGIVLIGSILLLVWSVGYYLYFWTRNGQTPGKVAMGIKIVTTSGEPISIGKAIVRYIGYIISSFVIGLGFLWVIWDARKQGWHDKIAGTLVVEA